MDKEVRFTQKKVDESWKEEVTRTKGESKPEPGAPKPSLSLVNFLTSLGYQVLMQLGELPHPETQERQLDLEGAKETIDLLVVLEAKTQGNRTPEEERLLKTLLPELQMKFVEKANRS